MDTEHAATTFGREAEPVVEPVTSRGVYYVSSRPEAYETNGEISHEEARAIGQTIAERAGRRFPGVSFKVDDSWHRHQHGMEHVAAYIEANWQDWTGHGPA
jgi:hypothetical protein